MKAALEEWRHWLEGAKHPCTVITDHKNLEYIRSCKRLNPRQARWALFFTRFDFKVTYIPRSKNVKADALSRLSDEKTLTEDVEPILKDPLIIAPIQWDIEHEIIQASEQHPTPQACPENKIFVPTLLRDKLIAEVHTHPSSGHPGGTATVQPIQSRYWWPSINKDVINFLNKCAPCQMAKHSRHRPAGLLQPLEIPRRPWSHIAIDFVTDLPQSQGNTTILTVVDRFSKACRLIAMPKLPTALETAELLCAYVFRYYGLPEDRF